MRRLRVDPLSPEAVARLADRTASTPTISTERLAATRSSSPRSWRRRRRDPEHGPGRGPRPRSAFEPRGAGPARGRRRRSASRRALAPGGAGAGGPRSRRGVPGLRDAELGSGRRRVPPRARSAGDRRVTPLGSADHPAPEGARGARGSADGFPGSREARASCGGGRRCGGGVALRAEAAVRAASLGAHREAAAQYARALRFGDRLQPEERAEFLEPPLRRVLPHGRERRSDRGQRAAPRVLPESSATAAGRATRSARCRRSSGVRAGSRNPSERVGRPWPSSRSSPAGRELAMAYSNLAAVLGRCRLERACARAGRAGGRHRDRRPCARQPRRLSDR